MFQVWSTYPGGRLAKDAKELDLMNPSTKAVPPQLTLLLTMDDQESDFNFQSGRKPVLINMFKFFFLIFVSLF